MGDKLADDAGNCEYCGVELTTSKEEHPCYVVAKAIKSERRQSVALVLNGHPGYALVIPKDSGYRTAVSFIFNIINEWPTRYLLEPVWGPVGLIFAIGATLGGLLVYFATKL